MKLAILGADRQTLAIARAIVSTGVDRLVACVETDTGPQAADFAALAPLAGPLDRDLDHWETLLDATRVDAVVVGYDRDEDRRAEQLRKFVQVGIPTLVAHPLFLSMLVYYELDMVAREAGTVLLPYLPNRLHPAVVELSDRLLGEIGAGIGRLEQITLERHLVERDPAAIKAQFARDADLLLLLSGELTHLGAMAGGGGTSYETLSVQMSGPGGVLARWSVAPAAQADSARLVVVAPPGRAVLTIPGEAGAWNLDLELPRPESPLHTLREEPEALQPLRAERTWPQWDGPRAALDQLRAAIAGQKPHPDWLDAARTVELAQTIDRSLARGRTIELHHEEYNEAGAFKSLMAASGCGLLLAGLLLLLVIGVIEDLGRAVNFELRLLANWPYLLLALLAVFLLLQLLLLAVRRDGGKKK